VRQILRSSPKIIYLKKKKNEKEEKHSSWSEDSGSSVSGEVEPKRKQSLRVLTKSPRWQTLPRTLPTQTKSPNRANKKDPKLPKNKSHRPNPAEDELTKESSRQTNKGKLLGVIKKKVEKVSPRQTEDEPPIVIEPPSVSLSHTNTPEEPNVFDMWRKQAEEKKNRNRTIRTNG